MTKPIYAIIPARGGSTRMPGKNISLFAGEPLLSWTIRQAKGASGLAGVYVSTDDKDIATIARREGASVIQRSDELSHAHADVTDALLHAIGEVAKDTGSEPELIVFLNATQPLRESKDIDAAINAFKDQGVDSLFSGADIGDFYIWRHNDQRVLESLNYNYKNRGRSQEFPSQYVENGSIYVCTPELLRREHNFLGGKIGLSLMDRWKSFEINTPEEFRLVEHLFRAYGLHQK